MLSAPLGRMRRARRDKARRPVTASRIDVVAPQPAPFRQRVARGDVVFGQFLNLGSPLTAELCASAGFDWLVIDLEHGAGDERAALAQIQAIAGTGAAAIVRVESCNRVRIQRALDMGAAGVLVPQLRNASDAEDATEYTRYSKQRGVARGNRARGWAGAPQHEFADADASVLCAVQIETLSALRDVDAIAAVDGVDVLFLGPLDLSNALGVADWSQPAALADAAGVIARAAARAGKQAGVLVDSPEAVPHYRGLGFTFIGCSSDGSVVARGVRGLVTELNSLRVKAP